VQQQLTGGCKEFVRNTNFVRNAEFIRTNCVIVLRLHLNLSSYYRWQCRFFLSFFVHCVFACPSLHVRDEISAVWQARPKHKYRTSPLQASVLETSETVGRAMRPKSKRMVRKDILILVFPRKLLQFADVAAAALCSGKWYSAFCKNDTNISGIYN
jgi:hypothetical protein